MNKTYSNTMDYLRDSLLKYEAENERLRAEAKAQSIKAALAEAKIEAALAIIQEALDSGMVSGDSCGHLLLVWEALKGEEGK